MRDVAVPSRHPALAGSIVHVWQLPHVPDASWKEAGGSVGLAIAVRCATRGASLSADAFDRGKEMQAFEGKAAMAPQAKEAEPASAPTVEPQPAASAAPTGPLPWHAPAVLRVFRMALAHPTWRWSDWFVAATVNSSVTFRDVLMHASPVRSKEIMVSATKVWVIIQSLSLSVLARFLSAMPDDGRVTSGQRLLFEIMLTIAITVSVAALVSGASLCMAAISVSDANIRAFWLSNSANIMSSEYLNIATIYATYIVMINYVMHTRVFYLAADFMADDWVWVFNAAVGVLQAWIAFYAIANMVHLARCVTYAGFTSDAAVPGPQHGDGYHAWEAHVAGILARKPSVEEAEARVDVGKANRQKLPANILGTPSRRLSYSLPIE